MNGIVYDIWLSLHTRPDTIGPGKLLETFGDAFGVYRASEEELIRAGVPANRVPAFADHSLDRAFYILRYCERSGVSLLRPCDAGYPSLLSEIRTPPRLLYVKGTLPDMDGRACIGMVGTRKMSVYGMEQAYRISYELASSGAIIVSGMARGIDGVSAAAAIEAGGVTVAVIGTGINRVFPAEHVKLSEFISSHGAVISEYPPDSDPMPANFPLRNRIISGLSLGTVVVEAGDKSGAVITANLAFEQNRRVFAVPGNVDNPGACGTNGLLRRGAVPVLGAEDVIEVVNAEYPGLLSEGRYADATLKSAFGTDIIRKYGVLPANNSKDNPDRIPLMKTEGTHAGGVSDEGTAEAFPEKKPAEKREPPEGRLRDIWKLIPDGEKVSPDRFTSCGYRIYEAMNLLSMLEISGFVKGVPGGMYEKTN